MLNSSQAQAVEHFQGPSLVLSGAGSGKTRVITHRLVRLLAKGVDAKKILCLTFTRKAAKEMKKRIDELVGNKSAKACTISTFHAWGLVFLKKHSHLFYSSKNFSLFDSNDQKEALTNVIKESNLSKQIDFSGKEFRNLNEQLSLAKGNLLHPPESDESIREVYEKYQRFLKNRKAFDFDDLLFVPNQILSEHPDLLKRYENQYDFIMVDEYQDTNHAQYHLLKKLTGEKKNLMVVGDDDQSIYSWRGAQIKNILDFEKDFSNTKVIRLETNYRSTQNIIACANGIISNNLERKEKKLIAVKNQGEKLIIREAKSPFDEAVLVAELIRAKMFKENLNYNDFAVLYRAKHQNKPIKEIFASQKLPYQVSGEIDFFNRQEIRDILALAKLLINPQDDLSLLRMINKPKRMRENCLQKLLSLGVEEEISIYDLLHSDEDKIQKTLETILKPSEKDSLSLFFHFINSYQNLSGEDTSKDFRKFINDVEYLETIRLSKDTTLIKQRREENTEHFFEILQNYFTRKKKSSLKNFIQQISIDFSDDKEEKNLVNLLTIHAAKGLEFPHVFIIGMEENILPFSKEGFPTSMEEERRLCYVAITRAQKSCTLSLCKKRKSLEGEISNPPSRFLQEISNAFIIRQYGKFQEKPPEITEAEKVELSKKAFDRMKEILKK